MVKAIATLKQRAMNMLGMNMTKPDEMAWVRSNLRTSDLARGRFAPKDGAAYIPYLRGWVDMCAKKNATNCAMNELMHFRKGGKGVKIGKRWKNLTAYTKGLSDGSKDIVQVENSTVLDWLARPSDQESGEDFKLFRFYAKEACGNAFVYLSDNDGMMTLRPQFVAPIFQEAENPIAGWVYGRGREREIALPFESVVQFKHFTNIDSPWLGDGPTKVCAEYADLLMFSTVAEAARWRNGNPPPYAVILPETITDPTKRAQAIAEIERQLNGPENAGNRMVLSAADIKNLGFPPKDMEYVEGTRVSSRVVLGAFDIPELLYFSTESGLATIEIALKHYYKTGIWPRLKRDARQLTDMFQSIGLLGENEFLAYENPSEEDNQAEATYWKTLVDAGLAVADTACADMGIPMLPDGLGAVPRYLGTPMVAEAPEDPKVEPIDGKPPAPGDRESKRLTIKAIETLNERDAADLERQKKVEERTRDLLILWFLSLLASLEETATYTIIPGVEVAPVGTLPGVVAPVAPAIVTPPPMAVGVNWSVPPAKVAELDAIVASGHREAVRASIAEEAAQTGLKPISPAKPVQIVDARRRTMVEKITNTTNNDIRAAISDGIANGKTVQEVAEDLKAAGYSKERAEVIASNEIAYASEVAAEEFAVERGLKFKTLYLGPVPCEKCIADKKDENARGGSTPIAQPYLNGQTIPPFHVSCYCTLVYHNRTPSTGGE